MAQFVTDSFNGTGGEALGTYNANWVMVTGLTGVAALTADGTKLRQTATGGTAGYYRSDAAPAGADYSVSADVYVSNTSGSGSAGPIARASASAQTLYHARVINGTGVQLVRYIAGTATTLGTAALSPVVGDTVNLKLDLIGSTINVHINGSATPDISVVDTNIAGAGFPGVRFLNLSGGQLQLDNFSADQGGGGTQSRTVTPSGGITLAGSAPLLRRGSRLPAGGLLLSGAAPVSTGAGTQSRTVGPVGGVAFAGAAAIVRSRRYTASGGISFAGFSSYRNSGFVAQLASIARRRARPRVITTR